MSAVVKPCRIPSACRGKGVGLCAMCAQLRRLAGHKPFKPRPELWSGRNEGQPVGAAFDKLNAENVRLALAARPSLYLEVPR